MRQSKHWLWSLLLCCSGWQGLLAQAATTDEFLEMSLQELVDYRLMSISRKEQRVADMAAAAYVVTADEIKRSGAQSIPDALRLVPGVNVAQISRNHWAVTARGFSGRLAGKLLVLVDGRNIYSPSFSGVLWESQDLVMEDVERIEVIRGPGAALWGTNAMNGVINIVTRTAAASQGTLVSTAVGTSQESSLAVRHGGELTQGGYYKLYAKRSAIAGSVETDSNRVGDDATRQQRVGLRVEPEMDRGQLSIQAEAHQGWSSDVWLAPSVLAYSDPGTPYVRRSLLSTYDHGGALQARYSWRGEEGSENILQAYADHEGSNYNGIWGSGTASTAPLGQAPVLENIGGSKSDIDLDFQQRRVWQAHDLIWGVNLRHTYERLQAPTGPYLLPQSTNQRLNYSTFVHDEITLKPDQLKLMLGSKFEHDGLTGFNIQPNARLLHTPNAYETYWTALSRSVRSPRRIESQSTLDVASFSASSLAPPGLLPQQTTGMVQISPLPGAQPQAEHALSLEGGWRRQLSNAWSIDTALFVTEYRHMSGARSLNITNTAIGQTLACVQNNTINADRCYLTVPGYNTNEDQARAWGGEISTEWHAKPWWRVQASYSHVRIKTKLTGDVIGDPHLIAMEKNTPRHQVMLSNNLRLATDWNLHVRARYNSATEFYPINQATATVIPAYTGLDIKLAWQYNRQTELSLLGRNLLKERHTEYISTKPYTLPYDVQRSLLMQAVVRY